MLAITFAALGILVPATLQVLEEPPQYFSLLPYLPPDKHEDVHDERTSEITTEGPRLFHCVRLSGLNSEALIMLFSSEDGSTHGLGPACSSTHVCGMVTHTHRRDTAA